MKFSELEIVIGSVIGIVIIALLINLFWANPSSIKICGDGECSGGEIGVCKLDCDWCRDGYCQEGEDCSSCSEDCGTCGSGIYCGDGICDINECISGCWKDCSYSECENGICEIEKGEDCVNSPNDCECTEGYCNTEIRLCVYQSCGNNFCEEHESYLNCPNDCKGEEYQVKDTSDINYPIIFVHGHSARSKEYPDYSINAFQEFQNKLKLENIYSNKGILLPSAKEFSLDKGIWGKSDIPISVRTTYYLGVYDKYGSIIGSEDEKSITEYGSRLKNVVDVVKHHTGKKKVILIAHSMGGLVSRSYIKNSGGSNDVYALITIGTPNHGVDGKESQYNKDAAVLLKILMGGDFALGCSFLHNGAECGDMWHQSNFILNLNSGDETYGSVKYYAIIGDCCIGTEGTKDDEVVSVDSSTLQGTENIIIQGEEVSGTDTFHQDLVHPNKVPEVYENIINILNNIQ